VSRAIKLLTHMLILVCVGLALQSPTCHILQVILNPKTVVTALDHSVGLRSGPDGRSIEWRKSGHINKGKTGNLLCVILPKSIVVGDGSVYDNRVFRIETLDSTKFLGSDRQNLHPLILPILVSPRVCSIRVWDRLHLHDLFMETARWINSAWVRDSSPENSEVNGDLLRDYMAKVLGVEVNFTVLEK